MPRSVIVILLVDPSSGYPTNHPSVIMCSSSATPSLPARWPRQCRANFYAQDWRDLTDLRRILRKLRGNGLANGWVHFKRDRETLTGAYTVRGRTGVSVWNAPPGVDDFMTEWVIGKRLTVTAENEAEVVDAIASKDPPLPDPTTT